MKLKVTLTANKQMKGGNTILTLKVDGNTVTDSLGTTTGLGKTYYRYIDGVSNALVGSKHEIDLDSFDQVVKPLEVTDKETGEIKTVDLTMLFPKRN